jgi:hypothetical protein
MWTLSRMHRQGKLKNRKLVEFRRQNPSQVDDWSRVRSRSSTARRRLVRGGLRRGLVAEADARTAAGELGGRLRGGGHRTTQVPLLPERLCGPRSHALVVAVVPVRPLRTVVIVEPDHGNVPFPDQNDEGLRAILLMRCCVVTRRRLTASAEPFAIRIPSGIRGGAVRVHEHRERSTRGNGLHLSDHENGNVAKAQTLLAPNSTPPS